MVDLLITGKCRRNLESRVRNPISAAKDEGIEDLIKATVEVGKKKKKDSSKGHGFLRAGTCAPLYPRSIASGGGPCS